MSAGTPARPISQKLLSRVLQVSQYPSGFNPHGAADSSLALLHGIRCAAERLAALPALHRPEHPRRGQLLHPAHLHPPRAIHSGLQVSYSSL